MNDNVNEQQKELHQQVKNLKDIREVLVLLLGFIDKLENKMVQERKRKINEGE